MILNALFYGFSIVMFAVICRAFRTATLFRHIPIRNNDNLSQQQQLQDNERDAEMDTHVERHHVLISGGSSGIGLALAEIFVRHRFHVTIAARNASKLEDAIAKIQGFHHRRGGTAATITPQNVTQHASQLTGGARQGGGGIYSLQLDVTERGEARMAALLDAHLATHELPPVSILVNCAGVAISRKFVEHDEADFERMLALNVMGAIRLTRVCLPAMLAAASPPSAVSPLPPFFSRVLTALSSFFSPSQSNDGDARHSSQIDRCRTPHSLQRIVFVSSVAGQIGLYGYTGYSASKFALRGFAEALQMEMQPHNIRIVYATPADTDTPGYAMENIDKPLVTRKLSEMAGINTPEQVAQQMFEEIINGAFLASNGAIDTWMLSHLTSGALIPQYFDDFIAQIVLMPVFKLISIIYGLKMRYIVNRYDSVHERN